MFRVVHIKGTFKDSNAPLYHQQCYTCCYATEALCQYRISWHIYLFTDLKPPPGIPQPCTLVPTPQRCCGSFCSHSCLIFILWVDECKIYLPSFEPTTLYPSMHHWWLCHILLPAMRCGSWSWPHSRMTLAFDLSKIKVALPSGFDHKATYYLT